MSHHYGARLVPKLQNWLRDRRSSGSELSAMEMRTRLVVGDWETSTLSIDDEEKHGGHENVGEALYGRSWRRENFRARGWRRLGRNRWGAWEHTR